jgi:serine/threonine protein kinase
MAECEHCGGVVPSESERCPHCGEAITPVPDELLGSEILGRYRLVKLIAEGGMGRVYLAEQAVGTVQRRVAVKVLRKQLGRDKQLMSRFAREAETLVRLTHPNTVQLFDFGALPDGAMALAMEYVQGPSLARELQQNGPLLVARAERMLTQICGALQEAHGHGIVHRDLKPDNLLIADRVGQGDFVKVLDFGIAKVSDGIGDRERKNTKLTQQGMIIGTPPYMSPEQFSGEAIDARSDIYSLGMIAYEMLSGKLPFMANTPWEWASRHLTATPESLHPDPARGLSAAHTRAIDAALQKKPEDRPQSVEAFMALFTMREGAAAPTLPLARTELAPPRTPAPTAANATMESTRPATTTARTGSLMRRRTPSLAGFVLVTIALASASWLVWLSLRKEPGDPAAVPAALPLPLASAPSEPASALPLGAAPPEEVPAPAVTHEDHLRRRHRRDKEASEATSEPAPAREKERDSELHLSDEAAQRAASVVPEAVVQPTAAERPASPEPAKASKAAPAKPQSVPEDLQNRIAKIQSSIGRPEAALGLYQAATGRYGAHPSLSALRTPLADAGEKRVRQLVADGRCAQAQAIQRALRSSVGSQPPPGLFGPKCPAP